MEITDDDLRILDRIIEEYSKKQFSLLGIGEAFPEVIKDIKQKQNTLIKIKLKLQSNTQKERR